MTDTDLQLLEAFLDGELSPPDSQALRNRLSTDLALAETLRQLQHARAARAAFFNSIEPTPADADRVVSSLTDATISRPSPSLRFTWLRHATALAACLLLGFVLGQSLRSPNGGGAPSPNTTVVTSAPLYEVAITDESGHVVATQHFDSLDQARQFSQDLRRSQEHQQQLFSSHATVRSDRF